MSPIAAWDLYPITDLALAPHTDIRDVVEALIRGGARVVQLRMKGATTDAITEAANAVLPRCRDAGVDLIINDDAEACRRSDADGLHIGQSDLAPAEARAIIGPDKILGLSTHSRAQFTAALREPADYLAVGPIFDTASKVNPDPTVGLDLLRWAREQTDRPLVAVGGISAANIASVIAAGADAVAVIAAVMKTDDIAAAVRHLRASWQ